MSAGKETVLVVWHLENQTKNFLPNLGCRIKRVTCSKDSQYIGLTLESNSKFLFKGEHHKFFSSFKWLI